MVRFIERRDSAQRHGVRSPDDDGDAAPVDLTCSVGERFFALEHTKVEPFENYDQANNHAIAFYEPIVGRLKGAVPSDAVFELCAPFEATFLLGSLKAKKRKLVCDRIEAWVLDTARTLPSGDWNTPYQKANLPDVPFWVGLRRLPVKSEERQGTVSWCRATDREEDARAIRIARSYDDKLGEGSNLLHWKGHANARTVLVLESNDLPLSSSAGITETVLEVEKTVTDRPDEVFLVCTDHPNWWTVTCIREDDKSHFDWDDQYERILQVDPAELCALTKR